MSKKGKQKKNRIQSRQNKSKKTEIANYRMLMHEELDDSSFALIPIHELKKSSIPKLAGYLQMPRAELSWAEKCFWFKTKNSIFTTLTENKTQKTKRYDATEIVLGLKDGSIIFSDFTPVVPTSLSGNMDGIQDKQAPPIFADEKTTELAKQYDWRNLEDGSVVTFTVDEEGAVQFITPELFRVAMKLGDELPALYLGVIAKIIRFNADPDTCVCGTCESRDYDDEKSLDESKLDDLFLDPASEKETTH